MGNRISNRASIRTLNKLQTDQIPNFVKNRTRLAKVTSCYDGDTCTIVFFASKEPVQIGLRLYGIDTAEMPKRKDRSDRTPEEIELAEAARDFLSERVLDRCVRVNFHKWDKWGGRVLGEIFCINYRGQQVGDSLNQQLIDAGLATEYHGKKKDTDWQAFHKEWKNGRI